MEDYGQARTWTRKAEFMSIQSSFFTDWFDRLRLRAATLTNVAATLRKRGQSPVMLLQTAIQMWVDGIKEGSEPGALSTYITYSTVLAAEGEHEAALEQVRKTPTPCRPRSWANVSL